LWNPRSLWWIRETLRADCCAIAKRLFFADARKWRNLIKLQKEAVSRKGEASGFSFAYK
jgi:hypothetical protein